MSRAFEAKEAVLKAYPEDRADGIDLFLRYLDISSSDFEYEYGMTPEQYIYGKDHDTESQGGSHLCSLMWTGGYHAGPSGRDCYMGLFQ